MLASKVAMCFIQPVEEKVKITQTSLHREYEVAMRAKISRKLSFSRWRQCVNVFFSEIKLARIKYDLCDAFLKIDVELKKPKITEQRKAELIKLKEAHLQDAILQRSSSRPSKDVRKMSCSRLSFARCVHS